MRKLAFMPALAFLFALNNAPLPDPTEITYLGLRGSNCSIAPLNVTIGVDSQAGKGRFVSLHLRVTSETGDEWEFSSIGQGFHQLVRQVEVQAGYQYHLEAWLYPAKRDGSVRLEKEIDYEVRDITACVTSSQ